jgi:putative nucleotidyltransferase with HDIG domain
MNKKPMDTVSFHKKFQSINSQLLRAAGDLARIDHPLAPSAMEHIKALADAVGGLQNELTAQMVGGRDRLSTLMEISRVINSSLGLERVLEGVMDSLIALIQAERGFLMLKDADGALTVRVARGIDHKELEDGDSEFSRTIVQYVANTQEPILTTNAQEDPRFEGQKSVILHQFRSILCAPLRTKDQVIGVIFLDNRVHIGLFDDRDLELLTAFANQAAIAIENARLFDGLQAANRELEAANRELETAYDATLKGWVRALDLRDKETKGHTQRVTILTRLLAKAFGFEGEGLAHITRGALLHDIGKMAIPDSILLKPGDLTPEERDLMKRHPVLAYEMLQPIQFLHPAIDIPHCHHERWDGNGYPRGLKGGQIPLMARIFAVADVWDALISDRPYRKGMDPVEVRQYIRSLSGTHFDPQVVEAFLGLEDLPALLAAEQSLLAA